MRRGEIWRYEVVSVHRWLTVLVSEQHILDNPTRRILYGVQLRPGPALDLLEIQSELEGQPVHLDAGSELEKLRRVCLTEPVGALTADELDSLDSALRASLGL